MINANYLNQLRNASCTYNLTDTLLIYRSENVIDEYGGVSNDFRLWKEVPCRFILNNNASNVQPNAGSINIHAEYSIVISSDILIRPTDKLYKKNDPYIERSFEIIKVDTAVTDGLFNTITAKERMD